MVIGFEKSHIMTNAYKVNYLSSPAYGGPKTKMDTNTIAYKQSLGENPDNSVGIIWCGGLKSDMDGSKASALHHWADTQNRAFVRFDYFGHGASSGTFRDGTISRWAADTVQVIDELTPCQKHGQKHGPQIIVGSSMGGWTALLAALARPERIHGLVLLAPAPDFTEKLMWANFSQDIRRTILEDGIYYEPSDYDEPYEISRELILDGRKNLLLDAPINIKCPVRIIQGIKDTSVPWSHAQKVVDALVSKDVKLTLVKNGDHSLSGEADIERIIKTLTSLT
jgi:pimeloyl-ACP methyl ester carboxylesterase